MIYIATYRLGAGRRHLNKKPFFRRQCAPFFPFLPPCEHGQRLGSGHADAARPERRVDGKSNEIAAIAQLLDLLGEQGCTVTIDAMGCQKAIARQIVEKKADCVLSLKGNHRHMHEVCKKHFAQAAPTEPEQVWRDGHSGHGRTEQRQCRVSAIPAALERAAKECEPLQCTVRVVRTGAWRATRAGVWMWPSGRMGAARTRTMARTTRACSGAWRCRCSSPRAV